MKYSIKKSQSEGITYIWLTSPETNEYAIVLPDQGGTVYQVALLPVYPYSSPSTGSVHKRGGEDQTHAPIKLLKSDAPEEIDENPWFRGRILFPFDDRVHAGRYTFRGKSYQLPINDPEGVDALHGFLYDQSLNVTLAEENTESALLRLEGAVGHKPGYPFYLHIRLDYRLDAHGFHISVHIENQSDAAAPFSVGWHPYFCSLYSSKQESGELMPSVNQALLKFPAEHSLEMDELLVPSGRSLPVEGTDLDFREGKLIGSLELDHGFINPAGYIECKYGDYSVRIDQSDLFSYSQVFVPPERDSIALEPISAATDAFNQPELGLRVLEPGETADGEISVRLF